MKQRLMKIAGVVTIAVGGLLAGSAHAAADAAVTAAITAAETAFTNNLGPIAAAFVGFVLSVAFILMAVRWIKRGAK